MKNLIRSAIWVMGFMVPVAGYATPVTWSFYETEITSCDNPRSCVLPPQPFVLMTLALPSQTSSGTATWDGVNPPVYTGDSFILTVPFTRPLTPAFAGNPGGSGCHTGGGCVTTICDFDISWSEAAGALTSISIKIDAFDDNIGPFGLTGGQLASDGTLGGCGFTQCTVTGYWQSDLAVPEPMSAVLLITGLLGTCLASPSRLRG
jgi:hypothetical protein